MSTTTEILHGLPIDPQTGSIAIPIYQTATFVHEAYGKTKGFDYGRSSNPTRKVLEDCIARLEKGHAGFAFATGLAAIDSVIKLLSAGDEILAVDDIYGGAFRLFTDVYKKLGISVKYVDTTNATNLIDEITPKTKVIWLETPTNPTLKISSIAQISRIAKENNLLFVVDNTFACPLNQKPLTLGADIVVHSATKYLAGHSDLVAGLVVCANKELSDKVKFIQNASGGILGPWDCFLTIRGIETLPLRYEKQSQNAQKIAEFLELHPLVDRVYYPGLKGHKNHEIANIQQQNLFGGVLSFSFIEDVPKSAETFVSSTKLYKLAESLGGVKSLVCHPATMTHASVPREKRLSSGIQDSLVRLSCGIELVEDLLLDINAALEEVKVQIKPQIAELT